ncbi:MAG TPA: ROK family protein [Vicinamibacterales bacterium]|nr:ROK family protein [Vicinamibacterales bacterium]
MRLRIGIDLGGTKIEAVAFGPDGAERFRRRIASPQGDYPGTIAAIASLVTAAEEACGERGTIGVGMPGTMSPATGLVKNANSTWLNGQPLHVDLERALDREVRLANDANCFALSEATDGAGAGADVVFGAILGTGTGGGVVIGGRALVGANAIAGEWGHNALPWPDDSEWPGPPCYCGRRGCIETFLNGAGLQLAYAGHPVPPAHEIADAAGRGDAAASAAVEIYTRRLAKALATVINLLDPDVVVLGGGLSNIETLYTRVPQLWSDWVFSDRIDTRLVRARYGDSSGVRGAAWLWPV